jgi:hypothetical protein
VDSSKSQTFCENHFKVLDTQPSPFEETLVEPIAPFEYRYVEDPPMHKDVESQELRKPVQPPAPLPRPLTLGEATMLEAPMELEEVEFEGPAPPRAKQQVVQRADSEVTLILASCAGTSDAKNTSDVKDVSDSQPAVNSMEVILGKGKHGKDLVDDMPSLED